MAFVIGTVYLRYRGCEKEITALKTNGEVYSNEICDLIGKCARFEVQVELLESDVKNIKKTEEKIKVLTDFDTIRMGDFVEYRGDRFDGVYEVIRISETRINCPERGAACLAYHCQTFYEIRKINEESLILTVERNRIKTIARSFKGEGNEK